MREIIIIAVISGVISAITAILMNLGQIKNTMKEKEQGKRTSKPDVEIDL
jgi:hypothetical protein